MKEPVWIDYRDALALHDRVLAQFGGAEGVRHDALLESALARPRQLLIYAESPETVAMAAAHTSGIVRNRPFADGNERTAFLVGVLFLELNGCRFSASEEEAAKAVIDLASGVLSEAGYIAFLETSSRRA